MYFLIIMLGLSLEHAQSQEQEPKPEIQTFYNPKFIVEDEKEEDFKQEYWIQTKSPPFSVCKYLVKQMDMKDARDVKEMELTVAGEDTLNISTLYEKDGFPNVLNNRKTVKDSTKNIISEITCEYEIKSDE